MNNDLKSPAKFYRKMSRDRLVLIVSGILLVVVIVVGTLYVKDINRNNINIDALTANVAGLIAQVTAKQSSITGLEAQLTIEKTNAADLEAQLAAQKITLADAQIQSNATKSDLTATELQVTSLTADLSVANTKVTSLTSDLAVAVTKLTSAMANLDKANSELAAVIVGNASQATELKKIKDPRHFDTLQELTAWLAADDTNTNPAYANLSVVSRAYVLQIKALRDGFLLPVSFTWDNKYVYVANMAVVLLEVHHGNATSYIYVVNAVTDTSTAGGYLSSELPSHPLPLP